LTRSAYDFFKRVIQINTLTQAFINKESMITTFEGERYGISYRALLTSAKYPTPEISVSDEYPA
jgi:hypothetical protein